MSPRHNYSLLGEGPGLSSYFVIDFTKLAPLLCFIAFASFTFCIVWSVIYDFESSTMTQCGRQPYNVLPSISAAIGGYSPQKEVWKVGITIQFIPRILLGYCYLEQGLDKFRRKSQALVFLAALFYFSENIALMALTYFDSTHFYPIHEKSFITFVLASELHMCLLVFLHSRCKRKGHSALESKGLKYKKIMLFANILGIFFAMYFFVEHNIWCLDYAYTKFALAEYVVVLSNILFHLTPIYDFPDHDFIINSNGVDLLKR